MLVGVNIKIASPSDLRDLVDAQIAVKEVARGLGGRLCDGLVEDTPVRRTLVFEFQQDCADSLFQRIANAVRPGFRAITMYNPELSIGVLPAAEPN